MFYAQNDYFLFCIVEKTKVSQLFSQAFVKSVLPSLRSSKLIVLLTAIVQQMISRFLPKKRLIYAPNSINKSTCPKQCNNFHRCSHNFESDIKMFEPYAFHCLTSNCTFEQKQKFSSPCLPWGSLMVFCFDIQMVLSVDYSMHTTVSLSRRAIWASS